MRGFGRARLEHQHPHMENAVFLTYCTTFSSSHYYYVEAWSPEKNSEIFGKSANRNGHGHNYKIETTVVGPVDPATGMVLNIQSLKSIVREALDELDHKNLNLEIPTFKTVLPTPENLTIYLWEQLSPMIPVGRLDSIRIFEDERLSAEYRGKVHLTRSYHFSAAHRLYSPHFNRNENEKLYGKCSNAEGHGHNYTLEITVSPLPQQSMNNFVNVKVLDQVVQDKILSRWDHRNLDREIEEFKNRVSTGENLAQVVWKKIKSELSDLDLVAVKVGETPNAYFEYRGG